MIRKYATLFVLAVVVALASPVMAVVALAQEAASNTTVSGGSIFAVVAPYILELASVLVAAIVAWLSAKVKTLIGIQIEAKHREALQSALQNGINLGMSKAGGWISAKDYDLKNKALAEGVNYVLASVPDAIKFFGLTPEKLGKLIEAKLPTYNELSAVAGGAVVVQAPANG
ncbi:hypothetical protein PMI07_000897 [Rhizobium sp. CF080]|uniref:hypothetical protein n=1 Tax=Rhizobium sp. (strain CF080) TaxID=1144310 RepID=UPI000271B4B6|nr:hypothetical protein [Rhizobium sp. CF080]EUB97321.1 hypothetical protein PMI07_000897 [Rhizobium sp. CF080]